jgi:hypothetical protein
VSKAQAQGATGHHALGMLGKALARAHLDDQRTVAAPIGHRAQRHQRSPAPVCLSAWTAGHAASRMRSYLSGVCIAVVAQVGVGTRYQVAPPALPPEPRPSLVTPQ